jgi:hypothetical protein
VAAVHTTERFADELHDAADVGLDVLEADVGEGVAVLVNEDGTWMNEDLKSAQFSPRTSELLAPPPRSHACYNNPADKHSTWDTRPADDTLGRNTHFNKAAPDAPFF